MIDLKAANILKGVLAWVLLPMSIFAAYSLYPENIKNMPLAVVVLLSIVELAVLFLLGLGMYSWLRG